MRRWKSGIRFIHSSREERSAFTRFAAPQKTRPHNANHDEFTFAIAHRAKEVYRQIHSGPAQPEFIKGMMIHGKD